MNEQFIQQNSHMVIVRIGICLYLTQTSHTKNYNTPRLFLMFRGIEYDFWLLRT